MALEYLDYIECEEGRTIQDWLVFTRVVDTVIVRAQIDVMLVEIGRGRSDKTPHCYRNATVKFFHEDYNEQLGHFLDVIIDLDSVDIAEVKKYRESTFW